jgi:hypothetical protein
VGIIRILCSVATKGRYFTTLPLVLTAIANQSIKPDKLIIYDDNDEPLDMRSESIYQHIFSMLDAKGIVWEWQFADKKGQHHIHQRANLSGFDWVWRVDDDAIPDSNVLETLMRYIDEDVGAIGGSIITHQAINTIESTGLIENINNEPHPQWGFIREPKEVQHLHCSFLYRAGVYDYNLGLSRVAHREETLFTYGLHQKGYKLLIVPNAITWHFKNPQGGIRSETNQTMYKHDEQVFRNFMTYKDHTIVILNCGMGDHIVFSHVLPFIKNPIIFSCYPEIVPGLSIQDAYFTFRDLDHWNIYKKMDQWQWQDSLENAFRKLYLC